MAQATEGRRDRDDRGRVGVVNPYEVLGVARNADNILGRADSRKDPFDEVRKLIEQNIHQFAQEIPEQEGKTRSWEAMKARIKAAGEHDLATPLLVTRIRRAELRIDALRAGIKLARQMLVVLGDYKYDVPITLNGRLATAEYITSEEGLQAMMNMYARQCGVPGL